ncbi:hypothetical protein NNX39_10460 [Arthrobacter sp. zg-Y826]|uniref:hypothetical protein n=1 Tax=Arthrobacter jinronghuae TaxID=2964609 RepID=UPI002107AA6F|nr:hypothetical protein [Arthrobacter jinronghuae]MCQ1956923.1 hypothetical protein [Arthrobacter jinronghuae]
MSITVDLSGTDKLPDTSEIPSAVRDLGARIAQMTNAYGNAQMKWWSLTDHYRAPEQTLVYTAMDEPRNASAEIADGVGSSVSALEAFAEAVEAIKLKRAALQADILQAQQADAAEDAKRSEDRTHHVLGDLFDMGEDLVIQLRLQQRADALTEELRVAEDACIRAHSAMFTRNTRDVVSVYGEDQ